MLLISVTDSNNVADLFKGYQIIESRKDSKTITAISDEVFSRIIHNKTGFTVVKTPLALYDNYLSAIDTKIIFDEEKGRIIIHKPVETSSQLFYTITSDGEFYCSTHISMLREAGVPILENKEVLPQLLYFGHAIPPSTIYKNINQVIVGSRITIDIDDDKCSLKSVDLWQPPAIDYSLNKKKAIEDIAKLFDEAIGNLEPCKNEIAILLSGGLDSTLILKTFQRLGFDLDKTYSAGYSFDDPNYEKEYAFTAAESLGVDHEHYEPSVEEYLSGTISAIDEAEHPLLHLQSTLIHIIKNNIPESKRIILNGQYSAQIGSSRNYKRYIFSKSLLYKTLKATRVLNPIYFRIFRFIKFDDYAFLNSPLNDPNNPIWHGSTNGNMEFICEYFGIKPFEVIKDIHHILNNYSNRARQEINGIRSLYCFNAMTISTWSKICESNQKGFYIPYNAMIDYSYTIPIEIKESSPKILQKEIMRQYGIPEYILNREKRGFNPVDTAPLLKGGIFEPLIPVASKTFDESIIRKIQPKKWDWERFWTFWHIINFAIWKRLYINNESKETLIEEC